MYNAKIHPEQYSNTLSDAQIKQLHKSLHFVCSTAVETKADSSLFPIDWLFKHRWGKGKKDSKIELPNGESIKFITVGGRTSAVVPSVQKKTGPVAADVKGRDNGEVVKGDSDADETPKPAKGRKRAATSTPKTKGKANQVVAKEEEDDEDDGEPQAKKARSSASGEKENEKTALKPKVSDGKGNAGRPKRKR